MNTMPEATSAEGVSKSRFYMWRAVFAMVHADGVVLDDEIEFAEHYLDVVPFSNEQKDRLRADLKDAQDLGDMLSRVSDPEDYGQFFQFARMLVWCDGDLDHQEDKILNHYLGRYMNTLDMDKMTEKFHESRKQAMIWRDAMEAEMEENAENRVGIGAIFKRFFGGRESL